MIRWCLFFLLCFVLSPVVISAQDEETKIEVTISPDKEKSNRFLKPTTNTLIHLLQFFGFSVSPTGTYTPNGSQRQKLLTSGSDVNTSFSNSGGSESSSFSVDQSKTYKDYYAILDIPRDSNFEQIKQAYYRQARKYHPDHNIGSQEAENRFKDVAEAWEILSDEQKRSKYDRVGKSAHFDRIEDYPTIRELLEAKASDSFSSSKHDKAYLKNLQRDAALLAELHQTRSYIQQQTSFTTATHSITGYPYEMFVFYTAVGINMAFNALLIDPYLYDSRRNPLWLEHFLQTIRSPEQLFGFFCFVFFSRQANYFYLKGLLDGFSFTHGPLKGYQIRALMPLHAVDESLTSLRTNAASSTLFSRPNRAYVTKRFKIQFIAGLGGSFGISAGMFASNTFNELVFTLKHSKNFKDCRNETLPYADSALACQIVKQEILSTMKSWYPELLSLVSASMISQVLWNTAYFAGAMGRDTMVQKGVISTPFIKNFKFRVTKRIPISTLLQKAWAIIPVPGFRLSLAGKQATGLTLKGVFTLVKKGATWAAKAGGPIKSFTSRVSRLLSFFWAEEWLTRPVANIIKDDIKAEELKLKVEDFARYYDADMEESNLVNPSDNVDSEELGCENTGVYCSYHPSLLAMAKLSDSWRKWRFHKVKEVAIIQQSWKQYIDNSLNLFSRTKIEYKKLLQSRKGKEFDRVVFFDGVNADTTHEVFSHLVSKIDAYFEAHSFPTSHPPLNLVSYSDEEFLKSDAVTWEKDSDHLFILRAMFAAGSPEATIEVSAFYDDYDNAFTLEQERQRQILGEEQVNQGVEQAIQQLKDLLTMYFKGDQSKKLKGMEFYTSFTAGISVEQNPSISEAIKSVDAFYNLSKTLMEVTAANVVENDPFIKILSNLNPNHPFLLAWQEYQESMGEKLNFIKQRFVDEWQDSIRTENPDNLSRYKEIVKTYFDGLVKHLHSSRLILISELEPLKNNSAILAAIYDSRVRELAENALIFRVRSAGLEYLEKLIALKTKTHDIQSVHIAETKEEKLGDPIPDALQFVFYRLGPENIFASLYEGTFVEIFEKTKIQLESYPRGMQRIGKVNTHYKDLEKRFNNGLPYQPVRINGLITPTVMDFILASAICGSDLSEQEDPAVLRQIQHILSTDNPQEAFEGQFADSSLKEVMGLIPVFDQRSMPAIIYKFFGSGMSYLFYPPKLVPLDTYDTAIICDHFRGEGFTTLAESPLDFRGKTYHHLLYLVLDLLAESAYSIEEFDRWWKYKIEPYFELFIMAMNREYKRVVQEHFIRPLFISSTTRTFINTSLNPLDPITLEQESSRQDHNLIVQSGDWSAAGVDPTEEFDISRFYFDVPDGIFPSLYFEMNYLANIIVHFAGRIYETHPEKIDGEKLQNSLQLFIEAFDPLPECSDENIFFLSTDACYQWAANIINCRPRIKDIGADIVQALSLEQGTKMQLQTLLSKDVRLALLKKDIPEELQKTMPETLFDILVNNSYDQSSSTEKSLPEALVDQAMRKLNDVFAETLTYAIWLQNLSLENFSIGEKKEPEGECVI